VSEESNSPSSPKAGENIHGRTRKTKQNVRDRGALVCKT
jgi:hypothetical protein